MSLWGDIVATGTGFATGGFTGAIAGLAGALTGGGAGTAIMRSTPTNPVPGFAGGGPGGYNMPFPVTGPSGVPLPGFNPPAAGGSCPKGYHLNKHALAATKHHGAVPAHSMCVRNRHMHPLNSKAIVHSLKRIKRASKIVRKLHAFSGPRQIAARSRGGHRAGCGCVVCRRR